MEAYTNRIVTTLRGVHLRRNEIDADGLLADKVAEFERLIQGKHDKFSIEAEDLMDFSTYND